MNIFITGANGFIGANLIHHLTGLRLRPHIILRKESNTWRLSKLLNKVIPHYLDLRDKEQVNKLISRIRPGIIIHCATYGGFPFQKDRQDIIQTNIMGTINLLNACAKFRFDCFINTGTSSEYGIKEHPMKESDLLKPLGDYGASKASATLFCQSLAIREKLPIVTLRLFSPYGYYEDKRRLIPSVIISSLKKEPPRLSSPDSVRDFIFIEDVMSAFVKAIKNIKKIQGEILNISYGRQYSVGEVVNKITRLMPYEIKPLWQSLPNPRREPSMWVGDISKAKKLLHWQPRYSLEEGLKKTIFWFKKNIRLYDEKS